MSNPPSPAHNAPQLTKATPDDIPSLTTIIHAAYAKYIPRIGKPPAPMTADYHALLRTHDVYVLRDGAARRLVGAIALVSDVNDDNALQINNVVVGPEAQGRGYGRVLMAHAETVARGLEKTALTLYTNVKMHENFGVYEKMGFVETGRRTEDGYERVFYRKDLR